MAVDHIRGRSGIWVTHPLCGPEGIVAARPSPMDLAWPRWRSARRRARGNPRPGIAGIRTIGFLGTKLYVPHADVADLYVVGVEGGRVVLVDAASSGVRVENLEGVDRSRPVFRIEFDGAPGELLSSDEVVASRLRDAGLVLLAADAFGAASRLIDLAVEYAKTREQFGQKIGQFQAVKHQLARLALDIEPTRSLFWYAGYAVDHLPEDGERAAALAKSHITDRALHAARAVVELHGGLGFTWDCDVQMGFQTFDV